MSPRDRWTRSFLERTDHVALRAGEHSWTYGELDHLARRHAAALAGFGLEPGDRVALLCGPRLEGIVALLAHYQAGLIHVPINTRYRGAEVAHILVHSGASAIAVDASCLEALEQACALEPDLARLTRILLDDDMQARDQDRRFGDLLADAPAPWTDLAEEQLSLMIYTSGTTGKSKGVAHTHDSVLGAIAALTDLWQWSADDVLCLALPLFHVHGLGIGVHGAILHGMTIDLLPRFSPEGVVASVQRGATIFMGVPTMYRRLLEHLERVPRDAEPLRGARLFTSGSAALPAADHQQFERLTGHRILERYGMSETMLSLSNPHDGERRPGSVGMPVPGFEARIVDEKGLDVPDGERGELWVRGVGLMRRYWRDPEATAASFTDDWFHTGDVAVREPDGYIRLLGRRSVDIIKSGGFKISAREIEEVIATLDGVAEVAVVGVADATWGQRIVAAVVPTDPGANTDAIAARVVAHAGEQLADYKKPRGVAIVDELPRNALGKIQKHRLIERLESGELVAL